MKLRAERLRKKGPRRRSFAGRIRQWRTELGLTQKEVAERLGVSVKTVSNWERGRVRPDPRHLPSDLDLPTDFRSIGHNNLPNLFLVVRYRMGLTQAQLAARLGVSKDTISGWERGQHQPRGETRREVDRLIKETLTEEERMAIEIRSTRVQLRLTQREFAARLGVGDSSVSRWERAFKRPSEEVLDRIRNMTP